MILVLLYCVPAFQAMLPIDDPDIWWHLRTGQWIIAHSQVPTTDPFSSYGAGKPWIAYSWLFEILVYPLYQLFDLSGILSFTVVMSLVIASAIHFLIRQAKFPFVLETVLVAGTLASMKSVMTPRPWLISIIFFSAQLIILRHVRRTGGTSSLWLLPLLYVLWANLHIQFIYGLAVIFLLVLEGVTLTLVGRRSPGEQLQGVPVGHLVGLGFLCVLATFVNPYFYNVYRPIVEYSLQTGAFQSIQEFHPLLFRSPGDWLVLALTVATFYVLGSKRRLLPFPLFLILMGCFLGFRARRDVWVTVVAAAFVISEYPIIRVGTDTFELGRGRVLAVIAGTVIAIMVIGWYRQLSEPFLRTVVERQFPVKAAEFVRENNYRGPLFNSLAWGGYLIWSLPELPVAMDGRTNLHGDRVGSSLSTWMGYAGWDADRELTDAQVVIAELTWPLTSLLRMDSRFKLVYEDGTAVVFVRNHS